MINEWDVRLTAEFMLEMRSIRSYIANKLLVPDIAEAQTRRIIAETKELNFMPMRFPLHQDEPWSSLGVRKLVVDNFVVLYTVNDKNHEVVALHVFYGGRDIDNVVK